MDAKDTKRVKLDFDDRELPANNLSAERIEEIDKVAVPLLAKMLENLRLQKPHLFRSSGK